MRILVTLIGVVLMCLTLAGCGSDDAALDESTEGFNLKDMSQEELDSRKSLGYISGEDDSDTDSEEPEPDPISLPEGFPESVPMLEGLEITSAEVLDAGKGMFKVVGASTMVIDEILEHYEAVFREGSWTEDMSMANEGMTIIAAIKDGLLVTVESHEGGLRSIVTITTGNL